MLKKFPDGFASVDTAVAKEKENHEPLNKHADFKKPNREVSDVWQSIKQYEENAEPSLANLEEASMTKVR